MNPVPNTAGTAGDDDPLSDEEYKRCDCYGKNNIQ